MNSYSAHADEPELEDPELLPLELDPELEPLLEPELDPLPEVLAVVVSSVTISQNSGPGS